MSEIPPEYISKGRFKAQALEYLRSVESTGEPVVITDNGRPAVEVRRYRMDTRSPFERLRGSLLYYSDPTDPVSDDDWEALQ